MCGRGQSLRGHRKQEECRSGTRGVWKLEEQSGGREKRGCEGRIKTEKKGERVWWRQREWGRTEYYCGREEEL